MHGDGYIYKRGEVWWISYYGPGKDGAEEVRESTGTKIEDKAKKILRSRTRAVADHRSGGRTFSGPRAERVTVKHLIAALEADYRLRSIKSLRETMYHAKSVRKFFGGMRAMTLGPDEIRIFVEEQRELAMANATINRRLAVLSQAFSLAIKEGRLTRAPYIPHLSEAGNVRKGFFEQEQHDRMLAFLPSPLDDAARFAYVCGWRKTEVRLLAWENVDRGTEVRLTDSKNKDGRVFPLEDAKMLALFERLWSRRQYETARGTAISEYVFHVQGAPLSSEAWQRAWAEARTAGGLIVKGRIFHDYRRTAVRNLIRAGVPQAVAMEITGHKTASVFQRYNITSTEDLRDAMRKVASFEEGKKAAMSPRK